MVHELLMRPDRYRTLRTFNIVGDQKNGICLRIVYARGRICTVAKVFPDTIRKFGLCTTSVGAGFPAEEVR